jgi:hypothetical protein
VRSAQATWPSTLLSRQLGSSTTMEKLAINQRNEKYGNVSQKW